MAKSHKYVSDSLVTISQLMLPSNSNFGGKIHGGFILSLMDQVAFACASKHSEHYCVTASVDKVDFLNPIEIGFLVSMKASVNFVGNSSMVVGIRVDAENIQTGERRHCNSSYFTMVAKDENAKNVSIPGLILQSKNEVRRFIKSMRRKEENKSRKNDFNSANFNYEDYLEELKSYYVQIDIKVK
jgi:acyl-CoA hydrolase